MFNEIFWLGAEGGGGSSHGHLILTQAHLSIHRVTLYFTQITVKEREGEDEEGRGGSTKVVCFPVAEDEQSFWTFYQFPSLGTGENVLQLIASLWRTRFSRSREHASRRLVLCLPLIIPRVSYLMSCNKLRNYLARPAYSSSSVPLHVNSFQPRLSAPLTIRGNKWLIRYDLNQKYPVGVHGDLIWFDKTLD